MNYADKLRQGHENLAEDPVTGHLMVASEVVDASGEVRRNAGVGSSASQVNGDVNGS